MFFCSEATQIFGKDLEENCIQSPIPRDVIPQLVEVPVGLGVEGQPVVTTATPNLPCPCLRGTVEVVNLQVWP